ncbi:arginase [Halocatena halophila]|uniref:arginase n=1 Tax=Halocatena halophila TaxID=2814576 RepID=UPI002ED473B2
MPDSIRTIGVPMDLGADRRGVDMGPSAIRYAGLADELMELGYHHEDIGDLTVANPAEGSHETDETGSITAKYIAEVEDVCEELTFTVASSIEDGATPLVLGGDHSIAIGSVRGSARDGDIGVVWFDAHGDFNTPETSPSGNVHGMPLAGLCGHGWFESTDWTQAAIDPERIVIVGVRNLDEQERAALQDSPITVFTMSDIDERGASAVTQEALEIATGPDGVHISLDLDWLDPDEAPGVGTPVRGGVTYREAHAAMESIDAASIRSFELVEVNPILDTHNTTAELAVELVASAFGKRIL